MNMLSFWEKNSFLNYDVIIIGGGIAGLSVAASLKEKYPGKEVLILERGILPTGASTKNAGFACFGSLTEILSDIRSKGTDETLKLIEERLRGIEILRKRLGDENIGYENNGGSELFDENYLPCLDEITGVNELLKDVVGNDVFQVRNDLTDRFGFNKDFVKALVFSPYEGQIDTGLMMRNLLKYVQSLGVSIITGCEAKSVIHENGRVSVQCFHNVLDEQINFSAADVFVCTNAFTKYILPNAQVKPARGQILVTAPIPGLKLRGIFHYDEGYYYFRNYKERIIFGGGRNLDFEGETSDEFIHNEKIAGRLKKLLKEVILPNTDYKIDYRWTGIMGFTQNKLPAINKVNENIYSIICCNGMGIALSSRIAEEAVNRVEY